jgi:aminopeptidase-like protein
MNAARDMMLLAEELFPIFRGITGDGLRRSLEIVARHVPLRLHDGPVAERAGVKFSRVAAAADALREACLLERLRQ